VGALQAKSVADAKDTRKRAERRGKMFMMRLHRPTNPPVA
jgi:hypothetical protein